MWNLKKMIQMNLFTKQRLIDTENKLSVIKGESGGGRVNQELGIKICILLYKKYITHKDLLIA